MNVSADVMNCSNEYCHKSYFVLKMDENVDTHTTIPIKLPAYWAV